MIAEPLTHSVKRRKPWYARVWLWIGVVFVLLLAGLALIAALLIPQVTTAKDALQSAVPLATQVKQQVLDGDVAAAQLSTAEIAQYAAEAQQATSGQLWQSLEWVPVAGENMRAARVVSQALQDLTVGVLEPASGISMDLLKPVDGAINVAGFQELAPVLEQARVVTEQVSEDLAALPRTSLIPQISDGLTAVEGQLAQLDDIFAPAAQVLSVLPGVLGAETPKNYLLIFQNNAEIRTTGGNPAALALLSVDNGRIEITEQASSRDFNNNRPEPILPLNPETQALYGDRVGTWMQDITFTPDFAETASLMRAFWAESFGTPVDAVVSFDPVALSYLVGATGPVTLATGDVITEENAVQLLLSDVYAMYPDMYEQDIFFASATDSIFSALTSPGVDMKKMISALSRAADEGRLIVSTPDEALNEMIGTSPMAGPLPADNAETTVLGVFLNDLTIGKMDYYLRASVEGQTTQCVADTPTTFQATIRMENTLDPATRSTLPLYVTADSYGYHGAIHTDVMMYGPVGTTVESVTVNGEIVGIGDRWDGEYRVLSHNGRPVLQVPMLLRMQSQADVTVTFAANPEQTADSFGEFDLRVTPTVHETPVTVATPSCS